MSATIREPAVAGAFYPLDAAALHRQLDQLVPVESQRHRLLACVAPHAGYIYSGGVAGRLFGHLDLPRRVVVLGPNHTGAGPPIAVAPHSAWQTPDGRQEIDAGLARRLEDLNSSITPDASAHRREHSIEVLMPFLRRRRPDVVVLPICLKHLDLDRCLELGAVLARLSDELDEPLGIVASSDMTHFLPDDVARDQDHRAIEELLERRPERLYDVVHSRGISMCGVVPATVALAAANRMGATGCHLVDYATSGDTSGDFSSVVGYAGVCIHE
jgi:AmmeMemoRadiSam system protein B